MHIILLSKRIITEAKIRKSPRCSTKLALIIIIIFAPEIFCFFSIITGDFLIGYHHLKTSEAYAADLVKVSELRQFIIDAV